MVPGYHSCIPCDITTIDVGGLAMTIEASRSAALTLTQDRFGSRPASPDEPSVKLRIRERTTADDQQQMMAADSWQELEGCQLAETDNGVLLTLGGTTDAFVAGSDVTIRMGSWSKPELKRAGTLMQFGVALGVAGPGHLLAHGAAIGDGDEAILVVGLSGQGKSTAAVAALSGGLSLLGDDLAVLDVAETTASGVQRRPVVPADLAARCQLSGTPVDGDGARQRLRLDVAETSAGPARLIGLIEVGHHSDVGALHPLDRTDLSVLDQALAVPPFPIVLRRHLPAMAALARLPKAELLHAADPNRRVERCAEMLEQAFTLFRRS